LKRFVKTEIAYTEGEISTVSDRGSIEAGRGDGFA
jgi:hypothetical protein